MQAVAKLFSDNMVTVFFIYGLSWFTMGVALLLVRRRSLGLKLADSIPWLAAFGITHAFVEWGDMLKLTQGASSALGAGGFLAPVKTVLMGLSVAFLVQFGAHLLANTNPRLRWLLAVPPVLFIAWGMVSLLGPLLAESARWQTPTTGACLQCHLTSTGPNAAISADNTGNWIPAAEVSARYLLYLPGLVLAAVAFWQQAPAFKALNLKVAAQEARLTAVVFALNVFFAGLVVAPAPYFPANILNYHTYMDFFPIPPQVFRALAASLTAIFMIRMVNTFEREHERQLEVARNERQRVQELYVRQVEASREEMARLNADLEQRVEERTRDLTTLVESAKALASTLEMNTLLPAVMEEIASKAGSAEASILLLYDGETNRLLGRASFGCAPAPIAELRLKLDETVAGRVFQEQRAVVCLDPAEVGTAMHNLSLQNRQHLEAAQEGLSQPHNIVCIPLEAKGRAIGCLFIANVQTTESLSLGLLGSLADQLGLAVDNARLFEETQQLASTDPLTGVWNRRAIEDRLRIEISRHRRQRQELSILMVDIDKLKLFNDTYGHNIGDQVITNVASVLRGSCREIDEIGRYGGDEFVVILPNTGAEGIRAVTARILENLRKVPLVTPYDEAVPNDVSIGGASYPADALDIEGLVSCADAAMYRAKLEDGPGFNASSPLSPDSLATLDSLQGLLATIDANDRYTLKHSQEVARYAVYLAQAMGMPQEEQEALQTAGHLHDIGKIGVPASILSKPGRLSPQESDLLKGHSRLGYAILQQLSQTGTISGAVLDAVLHCHERWDGTGYPDGLSGESIPKLARYLAVADAYSSMTTNRPYRQGLSREEALEQIRNVAGTQLDPQLAQCFASLLPVDKGKDEAGLLSPVAQREQGSA